MGTLVYDSRISTSPFMGPEHVHESTWAHRGPLDGLALTPDGFFLSGSADKTVKLWTLNGALERTFDVGSRAFRIAVMPDGVHFVDRDLGRQSARDEAVPRRRTSAHSTYPFVVATCPRWR